MPETKELAVGTYEVSLVKVTQMQARITLSAEDLIATNGDVQAALRNAVVDEEEEAFEWEVTAVNIHDITDDPRHNGEGKPW